MGKCTGWLDKKLKGVKKRDLCAKALGTLCLFVLATGALLLSRGSTLLIVAQLREQGAPRCGAPQCEREEVVYHDEEARPAWLWTLLLVLTIPHCITFIHSLILTLTKRGELEKPRWKATNESGEKKWGASNPCPACSKNVYPNEQVFAADRKPWHKRCLKCAVMGCR